MIQAGAKYKWGGKNGEAETPTGINIDDIDVNNAIGVHARYVIAINQYLDFGIEAQYEYLFESEIHGIGRNDTASSLFAGPSITIKIPKWKTNVGISPQFAVYNDFEAAHRSGTGPAVERFRLEMNLQKAF